MKLSKTTLLLGAAASILMSWLVVLAQDKPGDLATVGSVDLDRYAGRWYEIAKYPNKFQKDCVSDTTAYYTRKGDGRIEVVNECTKRNGKTKRAKGEARVTDKSSNAKLEVRFAPSFLSWLPWVWGDYWVIDLGDDYEYSVVGEPKREYFWILSRRPDMSEETYAQILERARSKGFDPAKVVRTPQNSDGTARLAPVTE